MFRVSACIVLGGLLTPSLVTASDAPTQVAFFEARVRPLLVEHCFACHGPKKQMAGLRLDSRSAVLQGSKNGPVVVPGQPEKSKLLDAVNHVGKLKMPPKGKLPPQAIATLAAWITMGVPWPEADASAVKSAEDEGRKHWAFQPIRDPAVPPTKDKTWPLTHVDRFILAKLEAKALLPSPPADPITLLRRLYFDLTGLPPTPEEVEQFVKDCQSPLAPPSSPLDKVVDRLLALNQA